MEDKIYIVTLYKHEDLEQFYSEMESNNFHLVMKRPMSRNTHYKMTEEQAKVLRQDPRVWDVQLPPEERGIFPSRCSVNYTPYNVNGNFWKGDTQGAATVAATDLQWGHVHVAGTTSDRAKGLFGLISDGGLYEQVFNSVDVFNDGKHVDVVICDDPVSIDMDEWISPSTTQSRFKTYDWYTELNTLVGTIDDDSQTIPSAPYPNYFDNATNTESHGTHVAGTVAGQHYGWAREANIYSMQILGNASNTGTPVPTLLMFDYLRAFHRNKAINPETGVKNPTISNHSWSFNYNLKDTFEEPGLVLNIGDFISVTYRGVTYDSGNPNPSGWTMAGLEADFGFAPNKTTLNADDAATNADVEDAISDGIVMIAAAGNNNFLSVSDGHPDYYNYVNIRNQLVVYYNRGAAPGNSPNAICVGSISNHHNFHRSNFSNFGPNIDIFAPGHLILSAYSPVGIGDTKYPIPPNYYYPISGTSMASPQVSGVIACLATGKQRFVQDSAFKYLKEHSIYNEMDFDVGAVTSTPTIFNVTVTTPGFNYEATFGTDRNGSVSGIGFVVTLYVGDTINFLLSNVASNHPFYIRESNGTTNVSTPTASGQGSIGNGTVSWTPNTVGSYKYICGNHPGMLGIIDVINAPTNAGTYADVTSSFGSPNISLHAKNPRAGVTGMMSDQIGRRSNGVTYPRKSTLHRTPPIPSGPGGQIAFTTPGTYNWECPVGVTSVSVVCVGAGGTGGAYGGSGGSLAYKNNISVTPGNVYPIVVGNTNSQIGGNPWNYPAEDSSAFECVASGGQGGYSGTASTTFKTIGTGYDGGGRGGLGSGDKNVDGVGYREGAGGGAGGYSGDGGNAGKGDCSGSTSVSDQNRAPTAGSGGGGGGGTPTNVSGSDGTAGGGGGVGLFGQGANGAAGTYGPLGGQYGGGGSGGADGTDPYGGQYGGGSAGQPSSTTQDMNAQHGAVRIIWPGDERQFPSTRTADE